MACVLPLALHPLSVSLEEWLQQWFFPPLPEQIVQIARVIASPAPPFVAGAAGDGGRAGRLRGAGVPRLYPERLCASARPGVAILLSSIAFGVAHMVPQQVFNAMLLGLVLGLFAVRSGSLLPGVLFHLIYNSVEILRARASSPAWKGPVADWFFRLTTTADNEHIIQYKWPTLAIAAVVALLLIGRW